MAPSVVVSGLVIVYAGLHSASFWAELRHHVLLWQISK